MEIRKIETVKRIFPHTEADQYAVYIKLYCSQKELSDIGLAILQFQEAKQP